MNILEVASVPIIIVATYLLLELYKVLIGNSEKGKNLIPVIAAILGIGFGVLLYFVAPEMNIADNVVSAIIVGMVSGLGATGSNQVIKQLQKLTVQTTDENTDENGNSNSDDEQNKNK